MIVGRDKPHLQLEAARCDEVGDVHHGWMADAALKPGERRLRRTDARRERGLGEVGAAASLADEVIALHPAMIATPLCPDPAPTVV